MFILTRVAIGKLRGLDTLNRIPQFSPDYFYWREILPSWLTGSRFWVHFATVALFAIALALNIRRRVLHTQGLDRIICLGSTFFAVPLALFGIQHFTAMKIVVTAVPSWMPAPRFWVYLVGFALIAAALSLITETKDRFTALLVGIMIFLFVLLIYVPGLLAEPHNRFALAVLFRDLSLSGGALALAGTPTARGRTRFAWLAVLGRYYFAVAMLVFGPEHFLHPDFAPGVPLEMQLPSWIPGHVVWAYLTGAVLIACGLCLILNLRARLAAASLGIAFLVLVICIYLPMEIAHPSIAISGQLDYVADTLAMSGAAFLIAGSLTRRTAGAPL